MLNKDNEKIELTPEQQNPGSAKPEDFEVIEAIPFAGQYGDTPTERKRLLKKRNENRQPFEGTPDRPNVNNSAKPKTGSRLR